MSIWLQQADLENATSKATVAAIFDDDNNNTANAAAVAAVIDRGEQEVLSWLIGQYGPTLPTTQQLGADNFLKYAALEYAVAHMFDRHPEYVRANGKERGVRFERADARMARVLQSRQRPPTLSQQTKKPGNVGGATVDDTPRIIVSNADGTNNLGDH